MSDLTPLLAAGTPGYTPTQSSACDKHVPRDKLSKLYKLFDQAVMPVRKPIGEENRVSLVTNFPAFTAVHPFESMDALDTYWSWLPATPYDTSEKIEIVGRMLFAVTIDGEHMEPPCWSCIQAGGDITSINEWVQRSRKAMYGICALNPQFWIHHNLYTLKDL